MSCVVMTVASFGLALFLVSAFSFLKKKKTTPPKKHKDAKTWKKSAFKKESFPILLDRQMIKSWIPAADEEWEQLRGAKFIFYHIIEK